MMNLGTLTKEDILYGPVPLRDLLEGSVYYPAAWLDGQPMKECNTRWHHLGVNSFVYCDYLISESELVCDLQHVCGYNVLAHRSLRPGEYLDPAWTLFLDPSEKDRYWDTFLGSGDRHPFAHWVVFERKPWKDDSHGPRRMSLLYIGGEGLSTFQQLYCHLGVAPAMVCFIQCWGFAGNWTNFTSPRGSFWQTLKRWPQCMPEWMWVGHHNEIHGILRLCPEPGIGICRKAFMAEPQFERVLGGRVTGDIGDNGRSVKLLCGNRRRGLAIRLVPNMGYMVYELTDQKMDPEEAVQKILMVNDARPAFPFRVTW